MNIALSFSFNNSTELVLLVQLKNPLNSPIFAGFLGVMKDTGEMLHSENSELH